MFCHQSGLDFVQYYVNDQICNLKCSSEPPWRDKMLAEISEGTHNGGDKVFARGDQQLLETEFDGNAATTEPFQNSNPDMELMFKEIDFESKRKAFNLFKNSNVKEQYSGKGVIAQEEILNAMRPLDSSPIIAPINSNSQQSQQQVLNMVNILDKEKLSTTAVKGNELDQSNQPPHYAIWKPPLWPVLKVNSDDAIFREQNFVSVGVVIHDDKGQVVAFMDKKITLPYVVTAVEMIAAKRALRLALVFGLSLIVLKRNSKNTIDALMCEVSLMADYRHLVDNAERSTNQFDSLEFSHVKREGNSAT